MSTTTATPITESADWPQVLARLEKIIALENAAGTEAEAAAAAAMTRLLTRYNLTRTDVTGRIGGPKGPAFTEERLKVTTATWARNLIAGIARATFCRSLYAGDTAYLIGEPRNVAAVTAMYTRIRAEIERITNLAWANLAADERPRGHYNYWTGQTTSAARDWKGDFRLGAVAGVCQAIHDAQRAIVAEVENGSALVLVKDEELNAEVSRRYPRARTMRGRSVRGYGAYERGRTAGSGIRVREQLT